MPNPKGNPENLTPLTTNRDEPLTERLNLRVTKSMMDALKAKNDLPEYCRQAIQKALDADNLDQDKDT